MLLHNFHKSMQEHFLQQDLINKIRGLNKYQIISLRHEDFIKDPKVELEKMLQELGLEYTEQYMESCSSIVYESPHKSRFDVEWAPDLIGEVEERMNNYPFLKDYSYND